tara:strand:- start:943 stop:1101 length:159 start_codon:yes stop_codon:yes gene_type:complete
MNAVSIEELVDAGIDEDSILIFMAHDCYHQFKSKSPRVAVYPSSAISFPLSA